MKFLLVVETALRISLEGQFAKKERRHDDTVYSTRLLFGLTLPRDFGFSKESLDISYCNVKQPVLTDETMFPLTGITRDSWKTCPSSRIKSFGCGVHSVRDLLAMISAFHKTMLSEQLSN